MHERFERVKDKVQAIMDNLFVGYRYSFEEDPEDSSVIYVNLFDVDPERVQDFKKLIRKEIRDVFECEDILFVPSIVTSDETRRCYGEQYLRSPDPIAALTERSSLAPSLSVAQATHEVRFLPAVMMIGEIRRKLNALVEVQKASESETERSIPPPQS